MLLLVFVFERYGWLLLFTFEYGAGFGLEPRLLLLLYIGLLVGYMSPEYEGCDCGTMLGGGC